MQRVEQLTQQARNKHFPNAPSTNKGPYGYRAIDYYKINNIKYPGVPIKTQSEGINYDNTYTFGAGRAHAPYVGANGVLSPYVDTLGTTLHETNHWLTNGVQPFTGTAAPGMAVVPGFDYGDEGTKVVQTLSPSFGFSADAMSKYREKLKYMIYHSAFNPGYPIDKLPYGYNNSLPELLSNARSFKQFAASKEVPSVGIAPDLSDNTLQNGTVPFNKAMVDIGMFSVNPKWTGATYDLKSGKQWQPRYLPGATALTLTGDNNLRAASGDMRAQLNYMQYLIDLGPNRTPYHNKMLKELQRKLPMIYEVAGNYNKNKAVTPQVRQTIPNNYMGGYTSPVEHA
jgi:hypothetical protein